MRLIGGISFVLAGFALLASILAVTAICPPGGASRPTRQVARQVAARSDTLIIQGTVDASLSDAVLNSLAANPGPIDTVLLSSPGGVEDDARTIGRALARAHIRRIVIPADYVCESACLEIVLLSAARFEPADSSRLMVHHEWETYGSQRCWVCADISSLANTVDDIVNGADWHRHQQKWANALAPGLGDRLARCSPNPFDTQEGVTITGLEFKQFRAGNAPIACPFRP